MWKPTAIAVTLLWALEASAATPTPTPTHFAIGGPTPTPTAAVQTTPTPGGAQCYMGGICSPYTGTCMGLYIEAGQPCPPVGAATPTPAVTPTPATSPTPTAPPTTWPAVTVTRVLDAADLGYNYLMAFNCMDGVCAGNGGVCCPGLLPSGVHDASQGPGEVAVTINYNKPVPVAREWIRTSTDTGELWEIGSVQMAHSDRFPWLFVGQASMRPAVDALIRNPDGSCCAFWPSMVWTFTAQSLDDKFFSWGGSVAHDITAGYSGWKVWPLGVIDMEGKRWLYTEALMPGVSVPWVVRWVWPDASHILWWTQTSMLGPLTWSGLLSGIAVDHDGTLIATTDEEQAGPPVAVAAANMAARVAGLTVAPKWWPSACSAATHVVRSTDQGRTWADTGIRFKGPAGQCVVGCAFAHKTGGAAEVPWWLTCTITSGKGPDASPPDWNLAVVSWPGAKLPANLGKKPVLWKASP